MPDKSKPRKIADLTPKINILEYMHYKEVLQALYHQAKQRIPEMTHTKFASLLGFSESNVIWLVMSDRRKLTSLTANRLCDSLGLQGLERRYFLKLVKFNNERVIAKKDEYLAQLMRLKSIAIHDESDQLALEYFSEWYHPVIRELSRTGPISTDPVEIAKKIIPKLLPRQIEESIALLERLGLVAVNHESKTFCYAGDHITPSRKVNTHASIRFHHAMMDIAKNALSTVKETAREYNGLTLSMPLANIPAAKEILRKACVEILNLEASNQQLSNTEVYQLNMQFFPFTKGESNS